MRFKIKIEPKLKSSDIVLPINYQYPLSSFIYKSIHEGNSELADWLHKHGFILENKKFKLFTFSQLSGSRYKIIEDRIIYKPDNLIFDLSFFPVELSESFVIGLFKNREFGLGDKKSRADFTVSSIERLPEPKFHSSMDFKAVTPVVITTKHNETDRYAQYIKPGDEGYIEKVKNNLLEKYAALCNFYNKPIAFDDTNGFFMEFTSKPFKKGITFKQGTPQESKIIGYQYNFNITAPVELIRTGYYAGFGEKNSQGFGCCEVI